MGGRGKCAYAGCLLAIAEARLLWRAQGSFRQRQEGSRVHESLNAGSRGVMYRHGTSLASESAGGFLDSGSPGITGRAELCIERTRDVRGRWLEKDNPDYILFHHMVLACLAI